MGRANTSLRVAAAAIIALVAASGCSDDYPFVRLSFGAPSDPRAERLCAEAAAPDSAVDPIAIHCALESGSFAYGEPEEKESLVVYSYNIERGLRLDDQLAALEHGTMGPEPDVLLIQEADRGCSRTDFRDVVVAYAQAREMEYLFAVEYLELPRASGGGGEITTICEHGNAILSRFPLGNGGAFRHSRNASWYRPPEERVRPGEPRLGGNIAVYADVKVGDQLVHLYSIHFEIDLETHFEIQVSQAHETASHVRARPFPAIVAGDTNAATYSFDLANDADSDQTIRPFLDGGFEDAHFGVPWRERGTRNGAIIDLILARGLRVADRGLCPERSCGSLSDHLPVWAVLDLAD